MRATVPGWRPAATSAVAVAATNVAPMRARFLIIRLPGNRHGSRLTSALRTGMELTANEIPGRNGSCGLDSRRQ